MINSNRVIRIEAECRCDRKLRRYCRRMFLILLIFFVSSYPGILSGVDLKPGERFEISREPEPLKNPVAFCVTEDGLFLIPDFEAGNIKIYETVEKSLTLVKTIGRKGYGANELAKPAFCFYNAEESKFGVLDLGQRQIYIYNRVSRLDFKRVKEIPCLPGGTDIQLKGNKLFISGYTLSPEGKQYELYTVDISNDKKSYLLPSVEKYKFDQHADFETQFEKKHIAAIGVMGRFDFLGDHTYFTWEGNLEIIKLTIKSETVFDTDTFGTPSSHYIEPKASEELLKARRKGDFKAVQSEKAKMSFVRGIFVSRKYVIVIYEGPVSKDTGSNFRVQFYTLDGEFIRDVAIPGQPDSRMWFDKSKNILYSLFGKSPDFFIQKYEIVQ